MISKELRRLSRRELVDIIYQLKKNEQEKLEEIAALEEALQEKRIRVSVAGSIAEAAADITQIFSVAQRTADLYLHEIASMKEDTEKECARMLQEARDQAEMILAEAQSKRG
jgi:cell division septum initiation protein DivIVA